MDIPILGEKPVTEFGKAMGMKMVDLGVESRWRAGACRGIRPDGLWWVLFAALLLGIVGCDRSTTERLGLPPLKTVEKVEISRFMGTWFEIASFPQSFQAGCTGTTATYTLISPGEIGVRNRCRKGNKDGMEETIQGQAHVPNASDPAKLKVSFFRFFWADYWIIDLDPMYEYAVVGHPSRDFLWVLSRSPKMEVEVYMQILQRLRGLHYQVERLQKTPQHG